MTDCWWPRGSSTAVACLATAGDAIACYADDSWVRDIMVDCPRIGPPKYYGESGIPPEEEGDLRGFSSGYDWGFG